MPERSAREELDRWARERNEERRVKRKVREDRYIEAVRNSLGIHLLVRTHDER
jgi:hypothetical protein